VVSLVERATPYLLSAALSPGTPETVVTPHGTGTVTAGVYVGAKRSERYKVVSPKGSLSGALAGCGAADCSVPGGVLGRLARCGARCVPMLFCVFGVFALVVHVRTVGAMCR
jgi:hypothetical protein